MILAWFIWNNWWESFTYVALRACWQCGPFSLVKHKSCQMAFQLNIKFINKNKNKKGKTFQPYKNTIVTVYTNLESIFRSNNRQNKLNKTVTYLAALLFAPRFYLQKNNQRNCKPWRVFKHNKSGGKFKFTFVPNRTNNSKQ